MKTKQVMAICFLLVAALTRAIAADEEAVVTWKSPEKIATFREASGLTNIADYLFFTARKEANDKPLALWTCGGNTENAAVLTEIPRRGRISLLMEYRNSLLFLMNDGQRSPRTQLWRSDGTRVGTILVKALPSSSPGLTRIRHHEIIGEHLYFCSLYTIWRTDGTVDGTQKILEMHPHTTEHRIAQLIEFDNSLFFRSDQHVWACSKEEGKAVRVGTPGGYIVTMDVFMGGLYVAARSLYVLDNAEGDLRLLKGILSRVPGLPAEFEDIRDTEMFFAADDGQHGVELLRTDGTVDGTQLVRDINRGGAGSCPKDLQPAGDFLLFMADDGLHGAELWRTDGTRSGTVMVKDLLPGPLGFSIRAKQWADGRLYFNAVGRGLCAVCVTDGTSEGTRVLKRVSDTGSGRNLAFIAVPNGVVFAYQYGLWFSSGTESSVQCISALRLRETPSGIASLGNAVYVLGKLTGSLDMGLWRIQKDE